MLPHFGRHRDATVKPTLISLGGPSGVVLAKDEVIEVGVPTMPPVEEVMSVNPQMYVDNE